MISNYLKGSGILYSKHKRAYSNENLQAMAQDINQIDTLKEQIDEELKDCNGVLWPHVCQMQSTKEGHTKIQDMIVRMIANEGIGIGSAIAQVEQELGHIL
jgi:hypothetical protein